MQLIQEHGAAQWDWGMLHSPLGAGAALWDCGVPHSPLRAGAAASNLFHHGSEQPSQTRVEVITTRLQMTCWEALLKRG